MVQTFGTFKSLADRLDREAIERTRRAAANAAGDGAADAEDTPLADAAQLPTMTHQERVNAEMFKAIEILGRKLDRHNEVQSDAREALNRRLALIESAATVDEKTGKLYLPVVMEAPAVQVQPAAGVPKWMLATTLLSGAVAVLALAIVVFRPVPPSLTEQQLAVLNALAETRMGALTGPLAPNAKDSGNWQPVEAAEDTPPPASELAAPAPAESSAQAPAPETSTPETPAAETSGTDDALATAPPQPEAPPAVAVTTATQDSTPPVADDNIAVAPAPAAAPAAPPVSLAAPDATPAAPVMPEAVTKAVTADEDEAAPASEKTAPAKTAPAKAEKPKAKAAANEPPPLVAGLDIGRDASLPQDLVPVETRAMEGVPAAQHDLATIYAAGKQVPQDYKRAVYWFAQAADGGIANADYNLGVMFQQGLGVKKDAAKAIGWYAKAADLGHPEAMYNLGIAYIEGVGAKRNVDEGIKYFTQAADAGVAQAAFNLGVLYESGFGGGIDLATARSWYEKAAKTGHKDARAALARLDAQMGQQADAPPIAPPAAAPAAKTSAKASAPPAAALTDADLVEPPQAAAPAYTNDLVGKVQRALIRNGLLPAPASGVMDARTEDAIRAWQAGHNLPADGVPSLDLLGQLNAESAAKAQSGSTGGNTSPPPRIPHHQF